MVAGGSSFGVEDQSVMVSMSSWECLRIGGRVVEDDAVMAVA